MAAAIDTGVAAQALETAPRFDAVCASCETVVSGDDPRCDHCGATRPLHGWSDLDGLDDPWLGKLVFDDLRVTRRLGEGSSARVYLAQSSSRDREFAVKIIDLERPGTDREENLATARREVQIASRLLSPHIVRVYQMRPLSARHVGVVMDHVKGNDLRRLVNREGPLSPRRAIDLVRQIAEGLHEAHQARIVHRDVKPENLLIHRLPNGDDFVRLTDFGIASPESAPTDGAGFVGTPLWASPEQVLARPLDPRSDIYSLGAVLYFLLTGVPPFNRGTYMTILRAHVHTPPPRLQEAQARLFSEPLERFCGALLNKQPEDRPTNMIEVLSMIGTLERTPEWDRFVQLDTPSPGLLENSETIDQTTTGMGRRRDSIQYDLQP